MSQGEVCVQGWKGGAAKGPKRASFDSSLSMNASTAAVCLSAEPWFTEVGVGGPGAE